MALMIVVEEHSSIFQSLYDFCRALFSGDFTARLKEPVLGESELQNFTSDFDLR